MPYLFVEVKNEDLLHPYPLAHRAPHADGRLPVCVVGDEEADEELMKYVDAELHHNYYVTILSPRTLFNRLEKKGYRVVAMSDGPHNISWTLHKEAHPGKGDN